MAAAKQRPSVLVIVGPSASGKSRLAHKLALAFSGEVIAADSRTIYKGMDLGSAKPSEADQGEVTYWGIDLVEPGQAFSAARFQRYAASKIKDIQARGRLPIIVGGSGLYVDGVMFNYGFAPKSRPATRKQLEAKSLGRLHDEIIKRGLKMPENYLNKRHLVRALERGVVPKKSETAPPKNWLAIGLMPKDVQLRANIARRVERSFKDGLVAETRTLLRRYGRENVSRTPGIAYKVLLSLLDGELDEVEVKEQIKTKEWQYTRRQRTWFKRNPYISWFETAEDAEASIIHSLNT